MKIKIELEIDTDNKKDCLMINELRSIIEFYDNYDNQEDDEGYEFND